MEWTSWLIAALIIGALIWVIVPSPETAHEHSKKMDRYNARMKAEKLAAQCLLRLIDQGIPEEKAAKMAVAYANALAEELNK
jgi:hypothetical protein